MKLNTLLLITLILFVGMGFKCGGGTKKNTVPVGSAEYPTPTPVVIAPDLRVRVWTTPPPTLQDGTIDCTAHALSFALRSEPFARDDSPSPSEMYAEFRRDAGGKEPSMKGVSDYAIGRGYLSRVRYTRDVEAVKAHILTASPVVLATLTPIGFWVSGTSHLDEPPFERFIKLGELLPREAHAWVVYGYDADTSCPDGSRGAFYAFSSVGEHRLFMVSANEIARVLATENHTFVPRAFLPTGAGATQ
ncbi:MAG: hypothetical protein MSG64_15720 [Pyrinomonadaceae bacterium MAG19_C2-C3]|nr:hypothetical protein [Pyrinomonadaceae bacterium MAG19_C2-C3]